MISPFQTRRAVPLSNHKSDDRLLFIVGDRQLHLLHLKASLLQTLWELYSQTICSLKGSEVQLIS